MHGPFNFAAHRPEVSTAAPLRLPSVPTPPLVDLGRTPSPPPVVEIPENAEEERRELMSGLTAMFPNTPVEYLEEQVQCIRIPFYSYHNRHQVWLIRDKAERDTKAL